MSVEDLLGQQSVPNARIDALGLKNKKLGFWDKVSGITEADEPHPHTLTGKVIRGGEWLLGGLSNAFNQNVSIPIAEKLSENDPLTQARLEAIKNSGHPTYLSDVTSAMGFLKPGPEDASMPVITPWGQANIPGIGIAKFGGRVAQDVVGDPLSYVGIGLPTKLGRAAKAIEAAKEAGQAVKLDSKVAQMAADAMKLDRPSATMVRNIPKSLAGQPMSEQLAGKQRSLLSFDIPGTDVNVPFPVLGTGKVAQTITKPFEAISRAGLGNRYVQAAKQLFSNRTGSPEYDDLVGKYRDLALYRSGEKVIEAKQLNTVMDDLTRELGIDRKTLNRTVSALVEKETSGLPARGISKVTDAMKLGEGPGLGVNIGPKSNLHPAQIPYQEPGTEFINTAKLGDIESSTAHIMTSEGPKPYTDVFAANDPKYSPGMKAFGKGEAAEHPDGYQYVKGSDGKIYELAQEDEYKSGSFGGPSLDEHKQIQSFIEASDLTDELKAELLDDPEQAKEYYDLFQGDKGKRDFSGGSTLTEESGQPKTFEVPVDNAKFYDEVYSHAKVGENPLISSFEGTPIKLIKTKDGWIYEAYNPQVIPKPINPKGLELAKKVGLDNTTVGFNYDRLPHFNEAALKTIKSTENALGMLRAKEVTNLENYKLLREWVLSTDRDALNKFLENQSKDKASIAKFQKALTDAGVPENVPVYVGGNNARKNPSERPLSYGSIYPWTAEAFSGNKDIRTYIVPREDIIAWRHGEQFKEGEVFFKTTGVKQAWKGSQPVAPLFAKAGEHTILSNKTPIDILKDALDSLDRQIVLGITKEEGKAQNESLRGVLFKLRNWVEATIKNKEKVPGPTEYSSPQLNLDHVDPKVAEVARNISESQMRQLINEQTSGVNVIPLTADREYLPHITTPEAIKAMRDAAVKDGRMPRRIMTKEMDSKLINSARREFVSVKPDVVDQLLAEKTITLKKANALKGKDGLDHLDKLLEDGTITEDQYSEALHTLGVEEVNQIARDRGLSVLGINHYETVGGKRVPIYNKVNEFFHTDPAYATGIRGVRGERARTSMEFFNELKSRRLALPEDEAPNHWLPVKQPELHGFKLSPEMTTNLNKWYNMISVPRETNAFLDLFDKTQNAWKAWTLAIFPAYHTRNVVGNIWNNWLAGVTNPKFYNDAAKIQNGVQVYMKDGLGKVWRTQELVDEARKLGVVDRGWYGGDIQTQIEKELTKDPLFSLGRKNLAVKSGMKLGKALENNARMGHFLSKLSEGMTSAEAASSVKKYLFDYGDLTEFEKQTMKRVFPFYTWTRKNIPLQFQHLITEPAKFGVIYKTNRELERPTDDYQLKYLPQWMQENFPTRIRYNKTDGTYEYFLLNSWLPAADLTKVFKLHEVAANMLSPIPKEILQQAFNYDFFTKQKIEDISGQKTKFLGVDLPSRVAHGAKIIRLLNEVDRMSSTDQSIWAKVGALATGKVYTVDPDKARMGNTIETGAKIKTLEGVLKKEARKPSPNRKEMDRVINLIRQTAGEY